MSDEPFRPAWSSSFTQDAIRELKTVGPMGELTREWAWGDSTGKGVRVAVVDSGVEGDHPALEGSVHGSVVIEQDEEDQNEFNFITEESPRDLCGHGTACAGIIHTLAPDAEIFSVRVLGSDMTGRAIQFAAGLRWAIENEMDVVNLSLSTSRSEYYALFHELSDEAYFNNVVLVSAVNNFPGPSYPSVYSSVISVAAHEGKDPFTYYYNPSPPVEFGAPGIDVKVAWLNKSYSTITGNSFAAPHIAGIVSLICAKHPELTPFQIKSILFACASNTLSEANTTDC
ncbi:MAG: S8 family serine peptidase [Anaerolineales bacterium]|nr:S8 family serine peptidase [Anaerolineales bacterium]